MSEEKIKNLIQKLESSDDDAYYDARNELIRIGKSAVPLLIEALKNGGDIAIGAAAALGEIGSAEAEGPICSLYLKLEGNGWAQGWSDRSTLIRALIKIGGDRSKDILKRIAIHDDIDSLKQKAIRALENM